MSSKKLTAAFRAQIHLKRTPGSPDKTNHDFVEVKKNLNKYVRKLVTERNALDEKFSPRRPNRRHSPSSPTRVNPPPMAHSQPQDGL
uniref:Uncharacterized protein n=1 Tax=Ditylenchus dipsaci TaxID=166011 RepID=A0A915EQS1_9BILA